MGIVINNAVRPKRGQPIVPEVEAAIYDLLTGEAGLADVGNYLGRSKQGVYILAYSVIKQWINEGRLRFTSKPTSLDDFKVKV